MTITTHRPTEHDRTSTMTSPSCPRLAAELSVMTTMSHVDEETLQQRIRDHRRWHPCPEDWEPVTHLPRDPFQEAPET